jgi:FkbM family methyltransferase
VYPSCGLFETPWRLHPKAETIGQQMKDATIGEGEWLTRGRLCFICRDTAAFDAAYREVFDEEVYRFTPRTDRPHIIDAGANLGLATCYFKSRYPGATVLAFEPDPRMCALYARNIDANGLSAVTLRPTALARHAGVARFYGDLALATPHALGNSLRRDWGEQRDESAAIEVPTERLSPHLSRDIDLLKLDIEGAELEVLEEAESCLHRVREIRMEVHQTQAHQRLARIDSLLRGAGFELRVEARSLRELLPAAALPWFDREGPEIFVVAASRRP